MAFGLASEGQVAVVCILWAGRAVYGLQQLPVHEVGCGGQGMVDAVQFPVMREGSGAAVVVVAAVAPSWTNKCNKRRTKITDEDIIGIHCSNHSPPSGGNKV